MMRESEAKSEIRIRLFILSCPRILHFISRNMNKLSSPFTGHGMLAGVPVHAQAAASSIFISSSHFMNQTNNIYLKTFRGRD